MSLSPIQFAGMQSLDNDLLVDINEALIAENVICDDGTLKPRNGSRLAVSSQIDPNLVQGIWRYRPHPNIARTVVMVGGKIYLLRDPSTEIAIDGSSAYLAQPVNFDTIGLYSGVQLGRYFYIQAASANSIMGRIAWDGNTNDNTTVFSYQNMGGLEPAALPAVAMSSLALKKFFTGGVAGIPVVPTLVTMATAAQFTDWYKLTPSAIGGTADFAMTDATEDWTPYSWIMFFVTPPTQNAGDGKVAVDVATGAGVFQNLGTTFDTSGTDSPNVITLPLAGLTAANRGAGVKHLKFTAVDTTHPFAVYGYMLIPLVPTTGGGGVYYVTFQNSTTLQESALSPAKTVTFLAQNPANFFPTYHSVVAHYSTFIDVSSAVSTSPDTLQPNRYFNKSGPIDPGPTSNMIGAIPTFSGTIPVTDRATFADFTRLWLTTPTGIRLVKQVAIVALQTTYTITDDQGDLTLTHDLYKLGGTAQPCNAIAARAQRLVLARENRIYVSSFAPTNETTTPNGSVPNDPYPQFPDIPQIDADGWSFDYAPSNVEQAQWMGNGDALYMLSNEAAYVITDLTPNSPPFKVFERGCLSRRGATWAEEKLFYAGWDGVYAIENRVQVTELSVKIRRMYREWLAPDATTVVSYQGRKLYVHCGLKFLRYDFVKQRWTRGTLPKVFYHATAWRDPSGSFPHLWYLRSDGYVSRWQPADVVGSANAATTDDGTEIPAWTYSTGYEFTPVKGRIESLYVDMAPTVGTPSAIQVSVHTSGEDENGRVKEYRKFAHENPQWGDLQSYQYRFKITGVGGAQLRRFMWERVVIPGQGAGDE